MERGAEVRGRSASQRTLLKSNLALHFLSFECFDTRILEASTK